MTICLALPEAVSEAYGSHTSFSVRKKKFAYYLNSHHGDGIVSVCCKAKPGINDLLLSSDPVHFYRPAYIGRQGWVGYRLDREPVDWAAVAMLISDSYRLAASKRLAALAASHEDSARSP